MKNRRFLVFTLTSTLLVVLLGCCAPEPYTVDGKPPELTGLAAESHATGMRPGHPDLETQSHRQ